MITKSGSSFRIQATLQEAKNLEEIAGNFSAEGAGEGSLFGMIDELTGKIKTGLNLSAAQISGDENARMVELTTGSPEAYKLWNEAYRLNYKGEARKSVELLEKAIAIDPQFASAYILLGSAYGNMENRAKSIENRKKAFELCGRLPTKERLGIQSLYFSASDNTLDKAIGAYNERLKLDPDDLNAARNLGNIYRNLEQWDKVLELEESNLKNRDEAYFPYDHAAYADRAKGLYNKAEEVLEGYLLNRGDIAVIHRALSENYRSISSQAADLHLKGLALLGMKSISIRSSPRRR